MTVFLPASFSGVAGAESRLEIVANHWQPYVNFNRPEAKGLAVDKARMIASEMGLTLELTEMPFKRVLLSVEVGAADGLLLASKTSERQHFMAFSEPFFCDIRNIYVLKHKMFNWQDETQLAGKTMGVGLGLHYDARVEDWIERGLVLPYAVTNPEGLMKMLLYGRVEFIVFSEREAVEILNKMDNPEMIVPLEVPLKATEIRMGFSLKRDGQNRAEAATQAIRKLGLGEKCPGGENLASNP